MCVHYINNTLHNRLFFGIVGIVISLNVRYGKKSMVVQRVGST